MTIGIGVLCSSTGSVPDVLTLISDSMGSTETHSTDAVAKTWSSGPLHAVGAGRIEVAAEIFDTIERHILGLPEGKRSHGTIWKSLCIAVNGFRSERFFFEVLRNEHVIENEISGRLFQNDPAKIQEAWKNYHIGAELLVGTFDDAGRALLYYIGTFADKPGWVHLLDNPAHGAIGTGSYNASAWLCYRNQAMNLGVKRSVYHAFEASRMAASAPTVNDQIELTIATKTGSSYIAKDRCYPDGPYSVTFDELENLYSRYGPQDTEGLVFSQEGAQYPQSPRDVVLPPSPSPESHGGSGEP